MALFTGNRDSQRRQSTAENEDRGQDAKLHEELSELSAEEHPRKVDRAKSEAEEAISDATLADIRGITLMERGRCPECGGRTESLLFTAVCAACGWFKRFVPEGGHCLVFLDTGDTIACDRVFEAEGDQILCIRDAVVRSQLARSAVRRIDYMWKDEELLKADTDCRL